MPDIRYFLAIKISVSKIYGVLTTAEGLRNRGTPEVTFRKNSEQAALFGFATPYRKKNESDRNPP